MKMSFTLERIIIFTPNVPLLIDFYLNDSDGNVYSLQTESKNSYHPELVSASWLIEQQTLKQVQGDKWTKGSKQVC